ncbi:uncharacterized protein KY384_005588 [Bacidia gigantensis]|uniref:uncharacterized protein n=1 Tax=Bacidia gigantensis TaxID=2732470 RepID=UPI001D051C84|nr:uncharacterized protein KY384_005588 [Bacidia gigantensis]KAG8530106.1 hypothetical protein KY384_005588 [Bacidia gigantensis]
MVNRGASKGCFKCRARKVKVFHPPRGPKEQSSADRDHRNEPSTRAFCEIKGLSDLGRYNISNLFALTESSENQAICYYFEHFTPRINGYWTDLLPTIYAKELSSSLLNVATLSMAYSFISLEPGFDHFKTLAISEYQRSANAMTENDSIPSPFSLDLISSYIDSVSSQYPTINAEMDDYYLLARQITCLGGLLLRARDLLEGPEAANVSREHIINLYHEARGFDLEIQRWPSLRSDRRPRRSLRLDKGHIPFDEAVYPTRIDIYASISQAASCCAWRLARVKVLEVLIAITPHLNLYAAAGEEEVFRRELSDYEGIMREYIDDICAAVPYFLCPIAPESIAKSYPHPPGQSYMPEISGLDLVSGMSQMNLVVFHASLCECAPRSQRQWLQPYLTLLSRDTRDKEIATRLQPNIDVVEKADAARFVAALSGPYCKAD